MGPNYVQSKKGKILVLDVIYEKKECNASFTSYNLELRKQTYINMESVYKPKI